MHFLYTREGAEEALGINDLSYRVNKALKAGIKPSRTIGGIEYFDLDALIDPYALSQREYKKEMDYFVEKQIKQNGDVYHFQPSLF
ncbi:hypothetical protein [Sulfurimonas indica]|uniref:hypothetical protein n=1 Tax=Sulfurimonas TaxID=202746 RepID=UPI0012657209|nr:hypothetical protein [Sulfurimonas indica]